MFYGYDVRLRVLIARFTRANGETATNWAQKIILLLGGAALVWSAISQWSPYRIFESRLCLCIAFLMLLALWAFRPKAGKP